MNICTKLSDLLLFRNVCYEYLHNIKWFTAI